VGYFFPIVKKVKTLVRIRLDLNAEKARPAGIGFNSAIYLDPNSVKNLDLAQDLNAN